MVRTRCRTRLQTRRRKIRFQSLMRGGGPRCDRWRTKLAVLQSKLALRHRHKGFERLAKQIYKAYLEVVTLFCNDRFRPSDHSDRKLQQATASLEEAYRYRLISHKDYATAVVKMTTAMSGVRGATARRLAREIGDEGIAADRTDRDKFLKTIQTGLKTTHEYPIELDSDDEDNADQITIRVPATGRRIRRQRVNTQAIPAMGLGIRRQPINTQAIRNRLDRVVQGVADRRGRSGASRRANLL